MFFLRRFMVCLFRLFQFSNRLNGNHSPESRSVTGLVVSLLSINNMAIRMQQNTTFFQLVKKIKQFVFFCFPSVKSKRKEQFTWVRFSYKNSCLSTASLIVVQQLCGVYRLPSRIDLTRLFTFSEYTHRVDTATLAHSTAACLYPRTRFAARRICEWKRIVKTKRRNKRRKEEGEEQRRCFSVFCACFLFTHAVCICTHSLAESNNPRSRDLCVLLLSRVAWLRYQ